MRSTLVRLGVNIDHVATLRQARREEFPDPVAAAAEAVLGGANGITAHLREDRRHIHDRDIERLKEDLSVPLNMEMAALPSIIEVAERVKPAWVCVVPERREELTTEGGLDLTRDPRSVGHAVERLKRVGVRVSLFIDPSADAVRRSKELGAEAIEIHTGAYARAARAGRIQADEEIRRIVGAAAEAQRQGLLVNAGHGIDYENVDALARAFSFHEFNIGFAIVARAMVIGLRAAVREMKERMDRACAES